MEGIKNYKNVIFLCVKLLSVQLQNSSEDRSHLKMIPVQNLPFKTVSLKMVPILTNPFP